MLLSIEGAVLPPDGLAPPRRPRRGSAARRPPPSSPHCRSSGAPAAGPAPPPRLRVARRQPPPARPAWGGRACARKRQAPFYGKSGLEGRRRLHVSKHNTCSDDHDFVTRRGLAAGGHSSLAAVTGATARVATGSGTGGFSRFGACLALPGAGPCGHGVGDGRIRPAPCDRNGRAAGRAPPRPGSCPARP